MLNVLLFSLMLFAASATATSPVGTTPDCGSNKAGNIEYKYCIEEGTSPNILYWMHGGGGSEKSWVEQSQLAQDMKMIWKEFGIDKPTVITISFRQQWLLTDVEGSEKLLPTMAEKVIPALEHKVGGLKGERYLAGPSMGGYNSAVLGLRYPQMFKRVALLCPGISTLMPWASEKEVEEFIAARAAFINRDAVTGVKAWAEEEFQKPEIWERHNPLALATKIKPDAPRFYVSCTKDDEYGFYDGAELFTKLINQAGGKATWISIEEGGHCKQTLESEVTLAAFLAGK